MPENSQTTLRLGKELKQLQKNPGDNGFYCELIDDENYYEWKFYIKGPKETPYEGGIFQGLIKFPEDYPYSPPKLKFISDFWHPNVYPEDGTVCISILHPPGADDLNPDERPEERWNPTQTPETILLSVISLLSDPNTSSPANVDASVEWRKNRKAFEERCKKLCQKANKELPKGFEMPKPQSPKHEVEEPQTPSLDDDVELEVEIDDADLNGDDDNFEEDEDISESEVDPEIMKQVENMTEEELAEFLSREQQGSEN